MSPPGTKIDRYCSRFRVTNGHRAAVCALVLCGQSFREACAIVGAPPLAMRKMVHADWCDRIKRPRKWKGDLLRDLEAAYRDRHLSLKSIAAMFGISQPNIAKLAIQHGWPRREWMKPLPKMTRRQRLDYVKLRTVGEVTRADALRAVGA